MAKEPYSDIKRENIVEEDQAKETGYTLSSVVNDIKKNWVDIKKLIDFRKFNKKY
jgi:hypothetical protein